MYNNLKVIDMFFTWFKRKEKVQIESKKCEKEHAIPNSVVKQHYLLYDSKSLKKRISSNIILIYATY